MPAANKPRDVVARMEALQAIDRANEVRLLQYVQARNLPAYRHVFRDHFSPSGEDTLRFAVPWALHHLRVANDQTPLDLYLRENVSALPPEQVGRMRAQREAWTSIWRVLKTDPAGASLTLRDELTGQEITVFDRDASSQLVPHACLLARVVPGDPFLFSGRLPRPQGPLGADFVVRTMQRKKETSLDALRDPDVTLRLYALWQLSDEELDTRVRPQAGFICLSPQCYPHLDRAQVIAALRRAVNSTPEEEQGESVFHVPAGRIRIDNEFLVLESSAEYLDELARLIESSCGNLLELDDVFDLPPITVPLETTATAKKAAYARWLDEPLIALDHRSPRDAADHSRLRDRLRVVLDQLEYEEAQDPENLRFDVDIVRKWLGFTPPQDYVLEAVVQGIKPRIWRSFRMPGRYTFAKLHDVLQTLFGWDDCHLHLFHVDGLRLGVLEDFEDDGLADVQEEGPTLLDRLLSVGASILYEYDFGDNWRVEITVSSATPAQTGTRPFCLDGQRAGPHEDCGGVTGYGRLVEILSNPRDPEHKEMRTWAGHRYDPAVFDVARANRALARRYPPPRTTTAAAPEPETYRPASGPPRLEHYRLDRLNTRQQMVIALEDGPLHIEDLAAHIQRAGTTLPHGVESLRKAWKRRPPIRERLDGRLELDREHSDYKFLKYQIDNAGPTQQQPAKPPQPPPPIDTATPLSLEELSEQTKWPSTWTMRRKILTCADARGPQTSVQQLRADLERLGQIPATGITAVSWRSGALNHEADDVIHVDRAHEDIRQARHHFRKWRVELEQRRQAADRAQASQQAHASRRAEQRQAFLSSRRVVLRLYAPTDRPPIGCLLWLDDMRVQVIGTATALRETLRTADWVFGLNPRRDFEHLDLEPETQQFLDLTPPFRTTPTPYSHGSSNKLTPAAALALSVPSSTPLSTLQELDTLAERGAVSELHARLENDTRLLHAYWRYGVEHNVVRRSTDDFSSGCYVDWDVGHERMG